MAVIGYAKLGRTIGLHPGAWGEVGGDNEPPVFLQKLARRYPQHEFRLLGRNSGEEPSSIGFPPNVTNPFVDTKAAVQAACKGNKTPMTLEQVAKTTQGLLEAWWPHMHDLDHIIVWAGQHGTSNSRIPNLKDGTYTRPQDSFVYYGSWLIHGLNFWRDMDPQRHRDIWLISDVRNYLKCRDLKWPPARVLSQFNWDKKEKHYRYGDTLNPWDYGYPKEDVEWSGEPSVWKAVHHYEYAALELAGIPASLTAGPFPDFDQRHRFGVLINENRPYVKLDRLGILQDWILPQQPDWLHGRWSKKAIETLGFDITSIPWTDAYRWLGTVKTTLTTPASGSGWATAKPWEAFAAGAVCFFHPSYDSQGHIIPTRQTANEGKLDDQPDLKNLTHWLRPRTPDELATAIKVVSESRQTYEYLASVQRRYFDGTMQSMPIFDALDGELT